MVPTKIFLTKGVGRHKEKLASFEMALRDAGVQAVNYVHVSSIFPPGCKVISKEQGLKFIKPGEITFIVMAKNQTDEAHRLISASVGMAIPADNNSYGYLSEHHAYGATDEECGEYAEDIAAQMLATTLGVPFDEDGSWDERQELWKLSDEIVRTTHIPKAPLGSVASGPRFWRLEFCCLIIQREWFYLHPKLLPKIIITSQIKRKMDLEIKGFIETSFLDWDGKVVSSLYVPLCNFRCPFCHNFGLVESPQEYETVPWSRIQKFLVEHKDFIDGVCLTGGEPCLHKERGLFEFMRKIKEMGFQVKIDTNGSDPACVEKAIDEGLLDYVAMDIKGPLDERYHKLSGVKTDLDKIKQSVDILMQKKVPYEFRVTVVPTLLDTKDVEDIAKSLKGSQKLVLQQFSAENTWDKLLREVKPYAKEKLEAMLKLCKSHVANTLIRGA